MILPTATFRWRCRADPIHLGGDREIDPTGTIMNAHPQPTEDGASADQASLPGPPPARLLRLPEVIDRVGLRRSAIYQRMSEGRFPKSRSLGPKFTVWVEEEIDAWIRSIADKPHRDVL